MINTVAHLDQQVHAVQVKVEGSDELTTLITTPNHPFWVQERLVHDQHWLAAEHLAPGMVLQIAGGGAGDNSAPRQATVYANGLIRHTQHAHIGFAADDRVGVGMVLDLTDPKQVHLVKPEQASELGSLQLGKPFLTPVYNFEVEDFHTYYVGDAAVWVHNTNCAPGAPVDFVLRKVDREAPRPQCFPVDTYVVTRDRQWIEIDRLDVGHWVLSRCEKTGQQDYRRVVKKFEHQRESIFAPETPLYRIIIVTAEGRKDALQATAEHPFWVNGVGWVKACELQPGQMLEICDPIGEDDCNRPEGQKAADLTLSGQRWQAEIESVCQDSESGLVYNIEVEDFHTYFVGCHGVWVHNKDSHDGVPVFSQPLKLSNPDAKAFAGKFNQNRRVEKAGDTIENNNAARAENEFADALAQHDNLEVVQLSNKNGLGKNGSSNPDVLVNARITDFYTPQKPPLDKPQLTDPVVLQKKLVTIYDTIKLKSKEQSSDVALNLRYLDGAVTEAQILEMMAAKPIPTLGRLYIWEPGKSPVIHDFARTDHNAPIYAQWTQGANSGVKWTNPTPPTTALLKQEVSEQGTAVTGAQLTHADLQTLLTAAKQHWLHMGANAAIVDSAHVSVGELPAGVAGQTLGRHITLSANGAGWGWFIDPTPLLSEEFSPLGDNTTLQAMRGLGADGQLDLLTVLIHEIGHVLGLDHEDEDDIMGATLEPGVRHLPDEEDAATLRTVSPRVLTSSTVGQADRAFAPLTVNLLSALNPQLSNPGFDGAQGWGTYGEDARRRRHPARERDQPDPPEPGVCGQRDRPSPLLPPEQPHARRCGKRARRRL
ncbi:MAG: matrixin family metalloprotease [Hydrogenophaga sp.]|nr:matrixin family metalloprotease [Hydrogenophaga sp.]